MPPRLPSRPILRAITVVALTLVLLALLVGFMYAGFSFLETSVSVEVRTPLLIAIAAGLLVTVIAMVFGMTLSQARRQYRHTLKEAERPPSERLRDLN